MSTDPDLPAILLIYVSKNVFFCVPYKIQTYNDVGNDWTSCRIYLLIYVQGQQQKHLNEINIILLSLTLNIIHTFYFKCLHYSAKCVYLTKMVVETDFNILIFEHILRLKFKNLSNKFFSVAGNTAQNAVVLPNPVVLLSMKNL